MNIFLIRYLQLGLSNKKHAFIFIIFICQSFISYGQGQKDPYGVGRNYVTPVAPPKVYITTSTPYPQSSGNYNYKSSSSSNNYNKPSSSYSGNSSVSSTHNSNSNKSNSSSTEIHIPKTADDYYSLGNSKDNLDKDYVAANLYYSKAIELDPNNAMYHLSLGLSKYKLKDYHGSLQHFTRAIEILPSYDLAYNCRGDSKLMLNDYKGAIEDYNKGILFFPVAETYYSRGIAKYNIEDYTGAAEDFTKTINMCDEIQRAWDAERQKEYSRLNSKAGKIKIENTVREIESEPMYAGSFYKRGSVKMKLKDLPEALKDFNKAIEIDPKFAEAYYTRGLINLVQGNKNGGCLDLKKAAELGYNTASDVIKKYCQ